MSQTLCRKNVNINKYFNEWDMRKKVRNLDWSLLIEGDIFLTWIILLEVRENLEFDLELQKNGKLFERANFFQFCTSVNQKEHYEVSRVAGDLN